MTFFTKQQPVESIPGASRRAVLAGLVGTGGLVLAARLLPAQAKGFENGSTGMPNGTVNDPHVFVAIGRDGVVSIIAHRSEMGPGARTSLPMVVADEMEADWARVRVVQADADEPRYGNQDTDGSRSIRHFLQPMRECGAAARVMLETAAAARFGVPLAEVKAEKHEVVHRASGRRIGFGDLADDAAKVAVPAADTLRLKDAGEFRYIGKGQISIVDLRAITTGTAVYGADVRLPGMKYAVIAHPPVVGGKVVSFDAAAALEVSGVERVLQMPGAPWTQASKFAPLGGVAVIARNTGAAIKGRGALTVQWDDGPNGGYDSDTFRADMVATSRKTGEIVRNDGDAEAGLKAAAKVITAEYYLPHLVHAPMEPPVATANVAGGKVEIWAPVQSPYGTRQDVAKALGVPIETVVVHVTLLGGGFGRKSKCDYAIEAALLSRELGAPVRLQWTREDDIRHGFLHTVSAQHLTAGLDASGKVTSWRHRSVAPSILSTFIPDPKHLMPLEQGMGLADVPFAIANVRCEVGEAPAHARIGWFRSVLNIPHGFAVQSFVDELAHERGIDPVDHLRELIGPPRIVDTHATVKDSWNYGEPWTTYPVDAARLRRVLDTVAAKAGWGRKLAKGEGMGIAVHRSFVSYVATVVRVIVDGKGEFSIPQVETVIDCGFHINPERIASQIEGAAIMGISLARYGEISFKKGRVEQENFNDFQVARMDDQPTVTNVTIIPAGLDVAPSGVGEPGLPPFAPALCNAIFAATGKRIRRLPILDQLKT